MSQSPEFATGVVTTVEDQPAGDELVADVAAGDTLLYLADANDFNEAGGTALLEKDDGTTVQMTYLSADLDADVLTLSTALVAAWPALTPVWVYPPAPERRTLVQVADHGDGIDARVPHALWDRLPLGSRDADTGENVTLYLDGSEWVVDDVLAKEPVLDGSFIDPDTMPPAPLPPLTDGDPPDHSPTPTVIGGIGVIFARWDGVVNDDPVTYEVHISPVSGFTPDTTTLVTTTPATSITIKTLPSGTALQYNTRYYVRLVAFDADNKADPGPEGSDLVYQITGPDIAADAVRANHIAAGQITGSELAADVVLGSKILTSYTGQHVEFDAAGLRLIGPTGLPIINLPTDPAVTATFDGQVLARNLTVTDGATLRSTNNTVAIDSGVTLALGVVDPVVKVTINPYWPNEVALALVSRTGTLGTFTLNPDEVQGICPSLTANAIYVIQLRSNGTRVWTYDTTGANVQVGGVYFTDYSNQNTTSMAIINGKVVRLYRNIGTNTTNYWLHDPTQSQPLQAYTALYPTSAPAIGAATPNGIIAERNPTDGTLRVRDLGAWNNTAGNPPAMAIGTTASYPGQGTLYGNRGAYVQRDTFDIGSSHVLWLGANAVYDGTGTGTVQSYPAATGSAEDTWGFLTGSSAIGRGLVWMGGAFWSYASDNRLHKHTGFIAGALPYMWAAVTWVDTVGTTHETKPGPLVYRGTTTRAMERVTLPAAPPTGGVDDPDSWALYMVRTANYVTPPATTSLQLQGVYPATTLAVDVPDVVAGAAPPTTNNYPAGNAGWVRSQGLRVDQTPKTNLDGAGKANVDGLIPPGTIIMYAGATLPTGWLWCDGALLNRSGALGYPDLFAAISTRYNTGGETVSQFRVPDLGGRVPVMPDGTTEFSALGKTGGFKTVTLATANLPVHNHAFNYATPEFDPPVNMGGFAGAAGTAFRAIGAAYADGAFSVGEYNQTLSTGSATAFSILQQYNCVNFIIKT